MTRRLHGIDPQLITSCACDVCDGVRNRRAAAPTKPFKFKTDTSHMIDALPTILGFRPTDSIVVTMLEPNGKTLGFTGRIDMDQWDDARADILNALNRGDAQNVIVMSIGGPDENTRVSIAEKVRDDIEADGISVLSTIVEDNPPQTPSAREIELAVESGRTAFLTRDQIVKFYEPSDNPTGPIGMTAAERDQRAMELAESKTPGIVAEEWLKVAKETNDPEAWCLTGFGHYLSGDGFRANVAFERALDADPAHQMTGLLRTALKSGLPPQIVKQTLLKS